VASPLITRKPSKLLLASGEILEVKKVEREAKEKRTGRSLRTVVNAILLTLATGSTLKRRELPKKPSPSLVTTSVQSLSSKVT